MTVAPYLEAWLERKKDVGRFRPSTALHTNQHLRDYWIPLLGHYRLGDLTVDDVDRALASIRRQPTRRKRLSPSSVRRIHATLRSALNDAVRRRPIPYNPAALAELEPNRRPKVRRGRHPSQARGRLHNLPESRRRGRAAAGAAARSPARAGVDHAGRRSGHDGRLQAARPLRHPDHVGHLRASAGGRRSAGRRSRGLAGPPRGAPTYPARPGVSTANETDVMGRFASGRALERPVSVGYRSSLSAPSARADQNGM